MIYLETWNPIRVYIQVCLTNYWSPSYFQTSKTFKSIEIFFRALFSASHKCKEQNQVQKPWKEDFPKKQKEKGTQIILPNHLAQDGLKLRLLLTMTAITNSHSQSSGESQNVLLKTFGRSPFSSLRCGSPMEDRWAQT